MYIHQVHYLEIQVWKTIEEKSRDGSKESYQTRVAVTEN